MRWPAHLDKNGAARAKRDLERLLRASASWDRPGRVPANADDFPPPPFSHSSATP